jgi:hypothetical protein
MIFGACQSCEALPLQCPYLEIAIAKKLVCWQIREWYTRTCCHYVNYYKGEQLYETKRRETALAHPRYRLVKWLWMGGSVNSTYHTDVLQVGEMIVNGWQWEETCVPGENHRPDKLYHVIMYRVRIVMSGIRTHSVSCDRHWYINPSVIGTRPIRPIDVMQSTFNQSI